MARRKRRTNEQIELDKNQRMVCHNCGHKFSAFQAITFDLKLPNSLDLPDRSKIGMKCPRCEFVQDI